MTTHILSQSDLSPVVAASIKASEGFTPSGGFPRFILICDGESMEIKTLKKLERELGYIVNGTALWVWTNYAKGATISTTKPDHA
jgi:hypothetical protein